MRVRAPDLCFARILPFSPPDDPKSGYCYYLQFTDEDSEAPEVDWLCSRNVIG